MTLEQVKQFIKEVHWGFLATTDGRIVGVRPMGAVAWKDKNFLCATHTSTDKVAQLKKVSYAEYCFCDSTGKHVRIAGPCTISTDNTEKLWLFKELPDLKDYFPDPASPEYVIVKMTPDNIRSMDPTDMKYSQVQLK
jgi:general stress protein 26